MDCRGRGVEVVIFLDLSGAARFLSSVTLSSSSLLSSESEDEVMTRDLDTEAAAGLAAVDRWRPASVSSSLEVDEVSELEDVTRWRDLAVLAVDIRAGSVEHFRPGFGDRDVSSSSSSSRDVVPALLRRRLLAYNIISTPH